MKLNQRTQLIIAAVVLAAGFTLPYWSGIFTIQLTTRGLYLGIVAMSFIWLAGYGDMTSLAQMSFAAIAGYVVGIGTMKMGIPDALQFPLGLLAAIILSAVFAWIAIRAQKIYFLVMTLALSQLFYGVGMQWVSVTGGQYGYTGIPRPSMLGFSLKEPIPMYFLTLIFTVLCYLALRRLVNSPFGLALQGIRDNPRRMAALGFNVQLHRYIAIVISGVIAGIAGLMTVYYTGVISPSRANLPQSVLVVMAALVGGVTSLEGGLLGGLVIAWLISIAGQLTTRYWTFIGALFILVVMFMPKGLLGGNISLRRWLPKGGRKSTPPGDVEKVG